MNIFFLHYLPKICAEMHVNKHVVKMILESVQLLCSAHHLHPIDGYSPPYKLTHKNHPCAKWVRESRANYIWLIELTQNLCKEYTYRYGKVHKCEREGYVSDLSNNIPDIPDIEFTLPAQAMPNEYKVEDDPVQAYRNYYLGDKERMLDWKNRKPPMWVLEAYDVVEEFENDDMVE